MCEERSLHVRLLGRVQTKLSFAVQNGGQGKGKRKEKRKRREKGKARRGGLAAPAAVRRPGRGSEPRGECCWQGLPALPPDAVATASGEWSLPPGTTTVLQWLTGASRGILLDQVYYFLSARTI